MDFYLSHQLTQQGVGCSHRALHCTHLMTIYDAMLTYSPAQEAQRIFLHTSTWTKKQTSQRWRWCHMVPYGYTLTGCMYVYSPLTFSSSLFLLSPWHCQCLVTSYKLSLLHGECGPYNPDNFVSVDIISTCSVLMGCLLQLELNLQTKVCACIVVYDEPVYMYANLYVYGSSFVFSLFSLLLYS